MLLVYFAKLRNIWDVKQAKRPLGEVADVFKALGHPARLRMVKAMGGGEKCVCELVEVAGLGWSTVSRHLGVLREAGVVVDEKRGQQVMYRVVLPCVNRFLACLEQPSRFPEMHEVCGCSSGGSERL